MVEVEMIRYYKKQTKRHFFTRFRRKKPEYDLSPGPRTAKDAMDANLDRIKEYYQFSTKQARVSFWIASALTIFSTAFLGLCIWCFPEYVIQTTCISVAGDTLAGVVFFTYRKSLETLNYYHRALHEDERFLVCMHFVEQIKNDDAQRNNLLQKLLLLEMQMNIIDIFASKGNNNSTFDSHLAEQIILSALNTPANTTDASSVADNPQENVVPEPSAP